MQNIPLQAIPRQNFNIILDGILFDFTLVAVKNCMYIDVMADGEYLAKGSRCVSGFQVLPYLWMENNIGNFAFETPNYELPWWENFGISHYLVYATASELGVIRAG